MSETPWLYTHTVEVFAEDGSEVLKAAVGSSLQDGVGGWVEHGKVAFERDVARCHVDAGAHALKRAAASVVPGDVVINHWWW